jgi:predicted RNA-binding protein with PUA domain
MPFTYEFRCKVCKTVFEQQVERMGEGAEHCGEAAERVIFTPPALKRKVASPVERGIRRDLVEMTHLEEAAAATGDRYERFKLNQEIQKINESPVTVKGN